MPIVEKATGEDLPWLRSAYRAMLAERQDQGMNFLPTDETVDWVMSHVVAPAVDDKSDGMFVAREDGKTVGALYWCRSPHPFRTRYEWACGWGMWVVPEWRQKGVIKALLEYARAWAKQHGIDRVLDQALTDAARRAVFAAGWTVSEDVVILEV